MTTSIHRVRRAALAGIAIAACLASHASAQPAAPAKPLGTYVFEETGRTLSGTVSTLAHLSFAANGAVNGAAMTRNGTSTLAVDVQGTFALASDGIGTLVISTSAPADGEGATSGETATYRIFARTGGEFSLLRTDAAYYTTGELIPSPAAALKPSYLLAESAGPTATRIATVNVTTSGGVSGVMVTKSLGIGGTAQSNLTGTIALQPNGFRLLTLSGAAPDEVGDLQGFTEQYSFLVTAKDIRALRMTGGTDQILTLMP